MTNVTTGEMSPPPTAARSARVRTIVTVAALTLAALVAGLCWAVSSPVGSSPDDDYHLSSIWCPDPIETSGCRLVTDEGGTVIGVEVPALLLGNACYRFHTNDAATCTDLLPLTDVENTTRIDRGDYPGLFYRAMHPLASDHVARSVILMRMVNVTLAVLVLGALALLASSGFRRVVVLATLASTIPLGWFIVASVNPSSWALVGVAGTWFAFNVLLLAERRPVVVTSFVLMLVTAGMAAGSRADAGAYLPLVVVAVLVAHGRQALRHPWRLVAPALAIIAGLAAFLTSGQRDALAASTNAYARDPFSVLFNNLVELPRLHAGVFGVAAGLGWVDTNMPAIVYVSAFAVAAGVLFVGFSVVRRGKVLAFLVVLAATIVLPLYNLQLSLSMLPENVQPRYILPLIPVLLGISLLGIGARTVGFGRGQNVMAYVLLVLANSFALHANIRRYVTGQDVISIDLNEGIEWWWASGPSPRTVWIVGSLAFAVLALAIFLVEERRRSEEVLAVPSPAISASA